MTDVLYNDFDPFAAGWLARLCEGGHIPPGLIDPASILDLDAGELATFRQVHFFAGIGGWARALHIAGLSGLPCWTGSPPCQPFSLAGHQKGNADERHLAPAWLEYIRRVRPPRIFGEQVADAIRHGWLDDLFNALERYGYTCGAAVLPACSVGAPHLRKRLFFGAVRLADTHHPRPQRRAGVPERTDEQLTWPGSVEGGPAPADNDFWRDADWLGCRDGKLRPVEPGSQPMADGIPARVGRVRGYGNAIVPQVAAAFILSFRDATGDYAYGA